MRGTRRALAFGAAFVAAVVTVGVVALLRSNESDLAITGGQPAQASQTTDEQCGALPSGFLDFNFVPASIEDLVDRSDAVVRVTAVSPENVGSQTRSDFSTFFNMKSQVQVVEALKGDLAAGTTISVYRTIASNGDLASALAQSKCAVGASQALVPGTSYVLGIVRAEGTDGWISTAGPYATVELASTDSGLVARPECVRFGDDSTCDGFPFNLLGTPYEELSESARGAV